MKNREEEQLSLFENFDSVDEKKMSVKNEF